MPLDAALRNYRVQEAVVARTTSAARSVWRQVQPFGLDESWRLVRDRMAVTVALGQQLAASQADRYLDDVLTEQSIDPAAVGRVNARRLAGVASDGRSLDGLLESPVITAKTLTAQGAESGEAMARAEANLAMIVSSQVQDAGRGAVSVAMTARPAATGYVRMLSAGACSRCAVLAGKFFRYNQGFARHPRCSCTHIVSTENISGDLRTDPKSYFDDLPAVEQDRLFTKSGAQAVRDGADIGQVVNAGRKGGMYTTADGLKATREGTTRRGFAGQRLERAGSAVERRTGTRYSSATQARLMPEQIYKQAGNNRDEAISLLKRYGYLI